MVWRPNKVGLGLGMFLALLTRIRYKYDHTAYIGITKVAGVATEIVPFVPMLSSINFGSIG